MRSCHQLIVAALCVLGAGWVSSAARGAVILPGLYQLHNHPDGAVNPPPYGLRLDELYNATPGSDEFTCNFDDPASDMKLLYNTAANPDTITISGHSLCGRDIGNVYATDVYKAVYDIYFQYNVGVGQVPGDDDIQVLASSGSNFGYVTHPTLGTDILSDIQMGNTFRFGDEDNDLGHRNYSGISGWGWLAIDGTRFSEGADDWLFTATYIPEPMTLGLCAISLLAGIRRRAA